MGAVVAVCHGKDCRKRKKRFEALRARLAGQQVRPVKCQDICKGPVVGVEVDGRWEWFKRVDTDQAIEAVLKLLERGEIPKRLKEHRVKKRRGKLRGKM
jgi:(2Fe-2S) ferredoxin